MYSRNKFWPFHQITYDVPLELHATTERKVTTDPPLSSPALLVQQGQESGRLLGDEVKALLVVDKAHRRPVDPLSLVLLLWGTGGTGGQGGRGDGGTGGTGGRGTGRRGARGREGQEDGM